MELDMNTQNVEGDVGWFLKDNNNDRNLFKHAKYITRSLHSKLFPNEYESKMDRFRYYTPVSDHITPKHFDVSRIRINPHRTASVNVKAPAISVTHLNRTSRA
ncbi:hypothetical protein QE152_g13291 [Popillia japonica]|uniref:Uncharacterized protein n=1 Tax=Popillia japonica TaxID=7064 RepID=A0AAW1LDZ1_POPJA